MEPLVIFGIVLALAFNFMNGLNDAAGSIATVVATKSLSPLKATLLAGLCNMIGPFILTTAVAVTIGTAIIRQDALTPLAIVVAMLVAILLVFMASRAGITVSSSHAMVGAILGAGIGASGLQSVVYPSIASLYSVAVGGCAGAVIGAVALYLIAIVLHGDGRAASIIGAICGGAIAVPILMVAGIVYLTGIEAIVLFIIISPVLGISAAFLVDVLVSHLFRHSRQNRMKRIFRPLHAAASLFQAAGHGANDGQHAVGVIAMLLLSAGLTSSFEIPSWVILSSAIAIGLGTCFGGWRVVDRMAKKITRIRPYQGFCAAATGSGVLSLVTLFGIPVSSTHVISGAIVGVGATRGKNAVQWEVVREMIGAWIVTIPLALVCAFTGYRIAAALLPAFA